MIEPDRFVKNRERTGNGDLPMCIVCGKGVKNVRHTLHVINGGHTALHPDDESLYVSDGGDMYHFPVGPDCLRRHPELREYVTKVQP